WRHRPRRRRLNTDRRQDRHRRTRRRPLARLVHRLRSLRRRHEEDRLLDPRRKRRLRRNRRRPCRPGDHERRHRARIDRGSRSEMKLFSEIEKTIERGFRKWTGRMFGEAQADELLLVHRAILEHVESKVQVLGRGKCIFPFSRVRVTLNSPDAERRTLYQAAFGEEHRLESEIREALEHAGCEIPRVFSVEVATAETEGPPFEIEYGTAPAPPTGAVSVPASATATDRASRTDDRFLSSVIP